MNRGFWQVRDHDDDDIMMNVILVDKGTAYIDSPEVRVVLRC